MIMRDVDCTGFFDNNLVYLFLVGGICYYTAYSFAKLYENADTQKSFILEENRDRSGIYLWRNLVNGNMYIGSSVRLRIRLLQYYNAEYLERNSSMRICRALLKYGYSNFSLTILEYCEPEECLVREKHYIDLMKPEYNFSQNPSSPWLGLKHTIEARAKMSTNTLGLSKSEEHKLKLSLADPKSVVVLVTDLTTNISTEYNSMSAAAKALGIGKASVIHYFSNNQKKPYKGRYLFSKVEKE